MLPFAARTSHPASVLAMVLVLSGCREAPEAEPAIAVAPSTPAPPAVTDVEGPFLLRYFAPATGELLAVRTPAQVPAGARGQVIVSPEDPALQGPWLFVADLTRKAGAGYTVHAIDRAELEASRVAAAPPAPAEARTAVAAPQAPHAAAAAAAQRGANAQAAVASADRDVILYRTPWCGYCKKAGQYLKLKGVPFVEKDIEQDPGAREDMLARAQRAGVPASALQGVPILYVRGKIISGFNREAIDRALAGG